MAKPTVKYKKALVENDLPSGGNILTNNDIKNGVPKELLPDIDDDTREDGWSLRRKGFVKKETTNPFTNGWLIVSRITEAQDCVRLFPGTPTDTLALADAYVNGVGAGELAASASIGVSGFTVDFENPDGIYNASMAFLVNKVNGVFEKLILAASGGVSWDGNQATLTAASAVTKYAYPVKEKAYMQGTETEAFSLNGKYLVFNVDGENSYTVTFASETTAAEAASGINAVVDGITASASGGKVRIEHDLYYYHRYFQITAGDALTELGFDSDVHRGSDGTIVAAGLSLGTIEAEVSGFSDAGIAGSGAYNNSTNPILANAEGGVDDDFTLTFSDDENFSISGVRSGLVGTGSIGSDCAPAHWSGKYFTIDADGWSGSGYAIGDEVVFTTKSASQGFWAESEGPADCGRMDPNRLGLKVIYEN